MPKSCTIRDVVHQPFRDTRRVRLSFWERWQMTRNFALGALVPLPLVVVSGALNVYWVLGVVSMLTVVAVIERVWLVPKRIAWQQQMAGLLDAVLGHGAPAIVAYQEGRHDCVYYKPGNPSGDCGGDGNLMCDVCAKRVRRTP